MSEHENSIDIDGLCCTECFYQGRIAERERILARLEEWKTDDCGNCPRCAANREIIWIVEGDNE